MIGPQILTCFLKSSGYESDCMFTSDTVDEDASSVLTGLVQWYCTTADDKGVSVRFTPVVVSCAPVAVQFSPSHDVSSYEREGWIPRSLKERLSVVLPVEFRRKARTTPDSSSHVSCVVPLWYCQAIQASLSHEAAPGTQTLPQE